MTVKENWKEAHRAVETAVAAIDRQFGRGTVMMMGDDSPAEPLAAIPSGSLGLDAATGVGGYPRGRITELFGPKESGVTTMALHAAASVQKLGGIAAFIDMEHALDIRYAAAIGVEVGKLYLSQPDNGELALEVAEILARSGGVDLIVVDSVNALTPRDLVEGQSGEEYTGIQARLMSQALRKLTAVCNRTGTCMIFCTRRGESEESLSALKFYAAMRLGVRKVQDVWKGDRVDGHVTRVRVVKNKVARPFAEAEFVTRTGTGISDESVSKEGQ